jgi:cell division protein FtsQ
VRWRPGRGGSEADDVVGQAPGLADGPAPDDHAGATDQAGTADQAGARGADPWRTAFFGVLAAGVLAVAVWAVLGSSLLAVRHVQVMGNHLVSVAEVRAAADIRTGTPLARVDTGAAARRVEQLNPVLSATVSRSWPDTIVISITERTPVLAVALSGGGYGLIDAHGVVVRSAAHPPAGMPVLTSFPAALRGSPAIVAAASVLHHLPPALRKLVRSVSALSASTVTLHLAHHITVVWGGAGQDTQKTEELDLLLRTHARYYDVSDPTTAVTQG